MAFSFNPLTGELDISSGGASQQFSFLSVPSGEVVEVPAGQQMLFDGDLDIEGELQVDGEVSAIVNYSEWAFGWNFIPADVSLFVAAMRDLLFTDAIIVDGSLTIDGRLVEVS